jgi:hypothetical protein
MMELIKVVIKHSEISGFFEQKSQQELFLRQFQFKRHKQFPIGVCLRGLYKVACFIDKHTKTLLAILLL